MVRVVDKGTLAPDSTGRVLGWLANNTTGIFLLTAICRYITGWVFALDPKYGMTWDGVTDDSAAFQALIDDMEPGDVVVLPPGRTALINADVHLPPYASGMLNMPFEIRGYGATLKTTAAGVTILGDPVPANVSAANLNTQRKLHIRGVRFVGSGQAGQVGFRPIGTYGLVVEDCLFTGLDIGCELVFALRAEVRSCFGFNNLSYTWVARSANGIITGATDQNSASNMTTFRHCRDFARTGQLAQFYILGSDSVALEGCITEGQNPVHAVLFDGNSSTTVKQFTVTSHHAENVPTGANFKLNAPADCTCDLHDLQARQPNATMIDASGSATSAVIIVDTPYLTAGTKFKHVATANIGPQWFFTLSGSSGSFDPSVAANWVDSIVPTNCGALRFSSSGEMGGAYPTFAGNTHVLIAAKGGGIYFQSTATSNPGFFFGSPTAQLLATVAPNPATFGNGYGVWWRDEAAKQLKFIYKDAAGTTRTLALPYTQTKLTNQTVNSAETTIAHGLGYTPTRITIEPTSAGQIWRSQASDATNIYLTADADGRTCDIYVG